MNKQAFAIAVGWALQCMTAQAAEPIVQPENRALPDAVEAAPRGKTSAADRRATAASARRSGIESSSAREMVEPTDRTRVKPRTSKAERIAIEPDYRPAQIVNPKDRTRRSDAGLAPISRKPSARGESTSKRVVQSVPAGRPNADPRDGSVGGLEPAGARGRALDGAVSRNSKQDMVEGPDDVLVRGKLGSVERFERWRAQADEVFNSPLSDCIFRIFETDGDLRIQDLASVGLGCGKGE
jgi:hypothetical protein